MKRLMRDRPVFSVLGLVALAAILLGLAYVQYQWSGQLSEVERERLQSVLDNAVRQFRTEFNAELLRLCAAFPVESLPSGTGPDAERLARSHAEWAETTADPGLLAALYVYESAAGASPELRKLDPSAGTLEPIPWPAGLEPVQNMAAAQAAGPRRLPPELRPFVWTLLHKVPALVHPILALDQPFDPRRSPRPFSAAINIRGYLVLELSRDTLSREILADLAGRHFGGPDGMVFQVGIAGRSPGEEPLFRLPADAGDELFADAGARVPLLWDPQDYAVRLAGQLTGSDAPSADRQGLMDRRRMGMPRGGGPTPRQGRFRGAFVVLPEAENDTWMLFVRHPGGSLEEVVAAQRRKNLALVFGVLALLAATMVMIVLATRRSQKLARLQMEFVAGVSHELRTPLAVIRSAGDNLADGIIAGSAERVREYGKLIRAEGRRLSGMVEQILQYASGRSVKRRYDLRQIRVGPLVDAVLEGVRPLIEDTGFSVERDIPADLPPVLADEAGLSQCLRDLIDNALKYGGEARWIRIHAAAAAEGRGKEVRLSVEDRGMGVDPADLPYIFEPFFRGRAALDNQIQGSGLGLSLTRTALQAMGARITAKSAPGRGSAFTLHLPASGPGAAAREEKSGNEHAEDHSAD